MADDYKRMQIKVLYSFNNNATVFLSRSKQMHSIKIAQIPLTDGGESLTLGAFDLRGCVLQILKSSPENFKLQIEDYAVYYKDITEQPDEPFVSNGVLLSLLKASKQHLVPGRVCQNLSASFLFGDQSGGSSQTLEIRLKLHTIEKSPDQIPTEVKPTANRSSTAPDNEKRAHTFVDQPHPQQKRARPLKPPPSASSSSAVKATRTKSLPIFYPQNQQIFNIINADKSNAPSKYDNKSVQDRFKLAPFLQAKILENPQKKYTNQFKHVATKPNGHLAASEPQRAMRTRSMMSNRQPMMISSPINEETDALDTDYQDTNAPSDNGLEYEDEHDQRTSSPYTPQQPPYNPIGHGPSNEASTQNQEQQSEVFSSASQFQSLPDLEDLDSRKTHAIPHYRLAKCHGLVCMNTNCETTNSITWRYFETGYHPNYLSLHRAKDFDIKHYDGMIGPLCNACYLFLRNKGFMRPEAVVKKYMQQQKYKKELRDKDDQDRGHEKQYASSPPAYHKFTTPSHTPSVINQTIRNNNQNANNVQKPASVSNDSNRPTPNYQNYNELNDFMNQLNSFGGPLTDLDLPQDHSKLNLGVTPPMMATKSNTRVINLYDEGEDKENWPPQATSDDHHPSDNKSELNEFETMIVKSISHPPEKGSPAHHDQTAWMNNLFGEPTPKDQVTPGDGVCGKSDGTVEALHPDNGILAYGSYGTPTELSSLMPNPSGHTAEREGDEATKTHPNLPQLRTFTTHNKSSSPILSLLMAIANMPSSPLLTHDNEEEGIDYEGEDRYRMSSPTARASRADTSTLLMSTTYSKGEGMNGGHGSTPNTDFYSNDDSKEGTQAHIKSARPNHIRK